MNCNTKRRPHVESIDGLRRRLALQWQPKNDAKRQQHLSTLRTHCYIFLHGRLAESSPIFYLQRQLDDGAVESVGGGLEWKKENEVGGRRGRNGGRGGR